MEDKMGAKTNIVDFYWDPVCPWCWITSRWMIDVCRQKQIQVNWKLFSLKIINADRNIPEPYKTLHAMGLKALRVAAAVRKAHGNDGLAKIYTNMGTRYHHDEEDIDTPEDLAKILEDIQKKGGIESKVRNDKKVYCNVPLVVGMYEYQLDRLTPEFVKNFNKYTTLLPVFSFLKNFLQNS